MQRRRDLSHCWASERYTGKEPPRRDSLWAVVVSRVLEQCISRREIAGLQIAFTAKRLPGMPNEIWTRSTRGRPVVAKDMHLPALALRPRGVFLNPSGSSRISRGILWPPAHGVQTGFMHWVVPTMRFAWWGERFSCPGWSRREGRGARVFLRPLLLFDYVISLPKKAGVRHPHP